MKNENKSQNGNVNRNGFNHKKNVNRNGFNNVKHLQNPKGNCKSKRNQTRQNNNNGKHIELGQTNHVNTKCLVTEVYFKKQSWNKINNGRRKTKWSRTWTSTTWKPKCQKTSSAKSGNWDRSGAHPWVQMGGYYEWAARIWQPEVPETEPHPKPSPRRIENVPLAALFSHL